MNIKPLSTPLRKGVIELLQEYIDMLERYNGKLDKLTLSYDSAKVISLSAVLRKESE